MDEFTPERVHLVVDGQVLGHAQGRLDGEWEEEWMELFVDEGYKAHGFMLGGGFYYLGSDRSGCRWGTGTGSIDGEVGHEGGIRTGIMIVRRDR